MVRKGSPKVRTGCITCKARKVKCDEAKPICNRCTSTGRRCDGYRPARQGTVSLHQPNQVFPGVTKASEGRALQYFCEIAGPVMSGAVDPYFWTHVVMQFSNFEPAVRHAVISISSLYEEAQGNFEATATVRHSNQNLALHHYNAAIHELRVMDSQEKQPIILLVCVLFICVEIMRVNRKAALQHSRHGVEILKSISPDYMFSWTMEHLLPIFRRLSEFALFFGEEESDFPDIRALEGPMPQFFLTFSDAQLMLDVLFNRTAEFMRSQRNSQRAASKSPGPDDTGTPPPSLLSEHAAINGLLDQWFKLYNDFMAIKPKEAPTQNNQIISRSDSDRPKMLQCFLLTRYECCCIWLNMAFDTSEAGYDRYITNFRRILKRLLWLEAEVPDPLRFNTSKHPHFIFEAGFGAMLFFLVSSCRDLETRLEFLRLMPVLGLPRENLWEADVLVAAARKIIELEHDIKLDISGRPVSSPSFVQPPGEMRVTDLWTESQMRPDSLQMDDQGVSHRTIQVVRRDSKGQTYLQSEDLVVNGRMTG
ncbi:hypothetical protein CSPX01_06252 [Colletotrichum filicis]|nr:hypothetical protein CSPX01_06252 [Colletotrichum filicis]